MNRPRSSLLSALFLSAALTLLGVAPVAIATTEEPADALGTPPTVFSPNRVIVQWTPRSDHSDRVEAREEADVDSQSNLGRSFQLVKVEPGQTPAEAVAELEADPAVVLAARDAYSSPDAVPNDTLFNQLWGLQNVGVGINGFDGAIAGVDVNVVAAWDRAVGSPSTVIAVIDSGYRFAHPDLGPVAWTNPGETANGSDDDGNGIVDDLHGADFVGANGEAPVTDGDPTDDDLLYGGHGVHTAGTAAAAGNDGFGITGVARNARIMPLRVCSVFASLKDSRCPHSSQIAAINYAGAKGARVANISLGGTFREQLVANALGSNPQTLFVISAGNDGTDNEVTHHYPCDFNPDLDTTIPTAIDNVICVAATNQADGLAGFSDYGAVSVDLGAPGTETLSAYPTSARYFETFAVDDFATKWTATGGGGFGRTNESPLTSFGIGDSPGVTAPANTARASTSASFTIPAGLGSCKLTQRRFLSVGTGNSYSYSVLLNGSAVFNSGSVSASGVVSTVPIPALNAGGAVQIVERYTTGATPPTATNGAWIDDIKLTCYEAASSTAPTFEFLQGTSMATPHVAGAAGLLFSLKPTATVTEVRNALLMGADRIPALADKTVSGGRLDVAHAMDALEGLAVDNQPPAAPLLTSTLPISPAANALPGIVGSSEAGSTIRIHAGASCKGATIATGTAAELTSPGIKVNVPNGSTSQFSARAIDLAGNISPCSAPISYTNSTPAQNATLITPGNSGSGGGSIPTPSCKVPALVGRTLGQAKAALGAAGCKLGKVTKPKAKKGRKTPVLVVKSSTPAVGSFPASGTVDLKLGPKPKKKRKKG